MFIAEVKDFSGLKIAADGGGMLLLQITAYMSFLVKYMKAASLL
jgi:hypothetical protein